MGGSEVLFADVMEAAHQAGTEVVYWSEPGGRGPASRRNGGNRSGRRDRLRGSPEPPRSSARSRFRCRPDPVPPVPCARSTGRTRAEPLYVREDDARVRGDVRRTLIECIMTVGRARIGFYCPGVGTGGPWRYVHSILGGLDPNEFDAAVYCDLPGEYAPRPWVRVVRLGGADHAPGGAPLGAPPAPAAPRARGPALVRLAPPAVRLWAGVGKQARRLARLFRRNPADLIHTQNTGCEESPIAAKLAGVRSVLGTFHVDPTYDLHCERSSPSYRLLELASNRCLDTAIAVSRATKRYWVRRTHIPANRVITIHNGIDPDKFRRRQNRADARRALGLATDGLIVGGLGRLEEAKGFTYLLAAAARLRAEFSNLTVVIAGAGPLRESLERQASQLGPAGSVRFLGFQSDVQTVLDSLDVFAMPSLCETLGYALLEAMATELPAVGSAVGGIPEVIAPGETGLVVPPRDAGLLADRLRVLLKDRALRDRWGAAGRHRVIREFNEHAMVQKTVDVYRARVARRKEPK